MLVRLLAACCLATAACAPPDGAVPTAAPATPTPTPGAPGLAVFYGAVTVDGGPASDGLTVVVEVNGANCGSGVVRAGRYELAVASDAEKRGCGKPGDTVVFKWGGLGDPGGRAFDQTAAWQPHSQHVDLTVRTR